MADYDVVIIGSGLAGLTAGLFAVRQGLSTLIMESNIPGGHLVSIEKIEDFPGFPDGIAGYDLGPAVQRQAADQGVEFQRAEVSALEAQDRLWSVVTEEERHRAKAVIVATGSKLKNLAVPGEEKLMGRGVSHCASCDGPLYNGQVVGVVGGGDSALQETLTLANYVERVLVFHDGEKFSAQQTYQQRILGNTKIMPRHRTVVEEVLGDD
ncbi:MAG TPA: FAD-dependent oxidoreductase, partial [Candidatus Binatia bacterium]|nr:FAD-dependent oxidoreductase [Candidatus Binatia bacterium]